VADYRLFSVSAEGCSTASSAATGLDRLDAGRTTPERSLKSDLITQGDLVRPWRATGRLEARIALPALFDRFPDPALAVPGTRLQPSVTLSFYGHRATRPIDHHRTRPRTGLPLKAS
jgi:hypothetical protein